MHTYFLYLGFFFENCTISFYAQQNNIVTLKVLKKLFDKAGFLPLRSDFYWG